MNDRPDDRTQLLAETLQGDWATGPAASMAQRAAAHARRRRVARSAATASALAALAVALFLVVRRPAPSLPVAPVAVAHAGYEIISDDELISTLHDRPLLVLPQENGSKKIVLLDR